MATRRLMCVCVVAVGDAGASSFESLSHVVCVICRIARLATSLPGCVEAIIWGRASGENMTALLNARCLRTCAELISHTLLQHALWHATCSRVLPKRQPAALQPHGALLGYSSLLHAQLARLYANVQHSAAHAPAPRLVVRAWR
jgi:hypothetical protein